MNRGAVASLVAGCALAMALVVHFGLSDVGRALRVAGWTGLATVSGVHLAAIVAMGFAWWEVAGGSRAGAKPWTFVWGRLIRDSGSEVLPLSQIGGYVLGARALALHGVSAPLAAATTVVDVTLEVCGQIGYTALGLILLLQLRPGATLASPVLIGLVVAVAAVIGFIILQRRGAGVIDGMVSRRARDWLRADAVRAEIHSAYRRRRGVWVCFLLHVAAWIGTGAEAWLALRLMGVSLGLGPILVIESMLYAVRSAAFFVPNAVGVQEGAYVMLGASFGLTPDAALALSLLKRGRDLLLGVPALLVWQFVEGRRFRARRSPARATSAVEPVDPPAAGMY